MNTTDRVQHNTDRVLYKITSAAEDLDRALAALIRDAQYNRDLLAKGYQTNANSTAQAVKVALYEAELLHAINTAQMLGIDNEAIQEAYKIN